jgi:hypothetical protein
MKPMSSEVQVPFRCFPGSLLKRVDHVNSLYKFSNIENTMFGSGVDPNLLNTWSHAAHRFPIVGFKPLLDPPQLEPRNALCVGRKSFEIVPGRSEPKQRLVGHDSNI